MNLLRYPNPILGEESIPCIEQDLAFIKENYSEMTRIMNESKGVGLAAVQVGVLKRFCLLANPSDANEPYITINPEIKEAHLLQQKQEGCLSLPLFLEWTDRFEDIVVTYRNENWEEITASFTGIEAQCLQHEINHFNGTLLIDAVSPMVREMWVKRAKKKGLL